jgi:hypothetical protein
VVFALIALVVFVSTPTGAALPSVVATSFSTVDRAATPSTDQGPVDERVERRSRAAGRRSGACQPTPVGLELAPLLQARLGYVMTDELGPRLDDEVEGCLRCAPDAREAGIVQDFGESRLAGLSAEGGARFLAHGVGHTDDRGRPVV